MKNASRKFEEFEFCGEKPLGMVSKLDSLGVNRKSNTFQ